MFPSLVANQSKYQDVVDKLVEQARSTSIRRAKKFYLAAIEFSNADFTSEYYNNGVRYTYPIINRLTILFHIKNAELRDFCEQVLGINDSNRVAKTTADILE